MKPLPHQYEVHVTGGPIGDACASASGCPDLHTAPPENYGGPGNVWSPEHLLLAAVQSCLLFTLRAVARASNLEFVSLDVDASGTVDRQNGVTRFTEIVLRPKLTVPTGADRALAARVLAKSEKACLISASLSTPVRMDAEILEADGAAAA